MTDTAHLDNLELRLSHERARLANAKTHNERELRKMWVAQIEKEIRGEKAFMGDQAQLAELTDDELLEALLQ